MLTGTHQGIGCGNAMQSNHMIESKPTITSASFPCTATPPQQAEIKGTTLLCLTGTRRQFSVANSKTLDASSLSDHMTKCRRFGSENAAH